MSAKKLRRSFLRSFLCRLKCLLKACPQEKNSICSSLHPDRFFQGGIRNSQHAVCGEQRHLRNLKSGAGRFCPAPLIFAWINCCTYFRSYGCHSRARHVRGCGVSRQYRRYSAVSRSEASVRLRLRFPLRRRTT